MKILVLGDCIANGLNVLWSEITQTHFTTESLRNEMSAELQVHLKNWSGLEDLKQAKKYLKEKEKMHSWPSYIENCINLSVTNETFQGMHKKLKKYLSENSKPDLVLLTDYTPSHRCVVVRYNNVQYVVKRDLRLLDEEQEIWPSQVYEIFKKKVHLQEKKGALFQTRKMLKSFRQLEKLLKFHRIYYKLLVFRHENQNISDNFIYCNQLLDLYKLPGNIEDVTAKLKAQKTICEFVMNNL
jgi:hypothetical protein